MITHKITPYVIEAARTQQNTSPQPEKFHGEYGSEEHRRFIHSRVLLINKFVAGDHCTANGSLGVVCHVAEEYEDAEWNGFECRILEVYLYQDNDTEMFHPNKVIRVVK